MQLNLALFLRLSRTLEGGRSASAIPDEHAAVLRALDRFLLTVQEHDELMRGREVAAGRAAEPAEYMVEETQEPTAPSPAAEVTRDEAAPRREVAVRWNRQHDLLYEDVLWLFKLGDNEGALISLGRLLDVAEGTQELQRFLEINQNKLVGLYEKLLGSFDKPFSISGNGVGERFFWDRAEAHTVLGLARQGGSIRKVLDVSPLPPLKTLSLMHRLHIERLVTFGDEATAPVKH